MIPPKRRRERKPTSKIRLDEVKLVNCANCGRELLGQSMMKMPATSLPDGSPKAWIHTRIEGRPYCKGCAYPEPKDGTPPPTVSSPPGSEASPGSETAIRYLEGE